MYIYTCLCWPKWWFEISEHSASGCCYIWVSWISLRFKIVLFLKLWMIALFNPWYLFNAVNYFNVCHGQNMSKSLYYMAHFYYFRLLQRQESSIIMYFSCQCTSKNSPWFIHIPFAMKPGLILDSAKTYRACTGYLTHHCSWTAHKMSQNALSLFFHNKEQWGMALRSSLTVDHFKILWWIKSSLPQIPLR